MFIYISVQSIYDTIDIDRSFLCTKSRRYVLISILVIAIRNVWYRTTEFTNRFTKVETTSIFNIRSMKNNMRKIGAKIT